MIYCYRYGYDADKRDIWSALDSLFSILKGEEKRMKINCGVKCRGVEYFSSFCME